MNLREFSAPILTLVLLITACSNHTQKTNVRVMPGNDKSAEVDDLLGNLCMRRGRAHQVAQRYRVRGQKGLRHAAGDERGRAECPRRGGGHRDQRASNRV